MFDLRSQEPAWEIQFDQDVLVPAIESGPDGSPHRLFIELSGLKGFAVVDFDKHTEVTRINFPDDKPSTVASGPPTHWHWHRP